MKSIVVDKGICTVFCHNYTDSYETCEVTEDYHILEDITDKVNLTFEIKE